jgi:hypothetical protein
MQDKRIGKKPPDHFNREAASTKLDSGPFIGKVKNNLDPTRSGRLDVWIADLGAGDEANPKNWRTVSYASPFFGSTYQPDSTKINSYSKVRHTYGFWAVPPDIGVFVLCTFVNGDPERGFWFACVPNTLGNHMVPGIAGSSNVDKTTLEDASLAASIDKKTIVAEFNENGEPDWTNFPGINKPVHEHQLKVLRNQGLERDFIRGIISSSSQREMPSAVFGISTPGRAINDPAPDPDFQKKLVTGDLNPVDYAIAARRGGHQFVMDDGDINDKDRLIRLRTAGGHQLLMNDSEQVLYIGNSNGSVWLEMTGAGHLNIFSAASINVRAGVDLNFHADNNINFNAGQSVNFSSAKDFTVQSTAINVNAAQALTMYGGQVNIGSDGGLNLNATGTTTMNGTAGTKITGAKVTLNEGGSVGITRPTALKLNKLSDTGKQGLVWKSVNGALETIVPIAPTHEPWSLHQTVTAAAPAPAPVPVAPKASAEVPVAAATPVVAAASPFAAFSQVQAVAQPLPTPAPNVISGDPPAKPLPVVECAGSTAPPADQGPKAAVGKPVRKPLNKNYLKRPDAPNPPAGIGPLAKTHTKAVFAQLAWSESSWDYTSVNELNYIGKYQMGASALTTLGYLKNDAYKQYGNKASNYPSSWTTKANNEGINSKADFLSNPAFQEKVMMENTTFNYKVLRHITALHDGDDLCTVAGMLCASHLIGAGAAKTWRRTGEGGDANGVTGTAYFNMGRYAVDVLAAAA